MSEFRVEIVSWQGFYGELVRIRDTVFIGEQNVPEELERDPKDREYIHALAMDCENRGIGTGRLLDSGKIGRMAVLKPWRGKGVGKVLLETLIEAARMSELPEVFLEAQIHAQGFYESQGFVAYGEHFMDAGIPHIAMKHSLTL